MEDTTTSNILHDPTLFSSKEFGLQLHLYYQELSQTYENGTLHTLIKKDFVELCDYFITTSSNEYTKVEQNTSDVEEVYVLHHKISEAFKDVILLHRDVLLQLQIANHKHIEGKVEDDELKAHTEASKNVLMEALKALHQNLLFERDEVYKDVKKRDKIVRNFKHFKNPWPVYKEQFLELISQFKAIETGNDELLKTIYQFKKITDYSQSNCGYIIHNAEYLVATSSKVIDSLKTIKTVGDIKQTLGYTEGLVAKIKENNQEKDDYTEAIELKIKPLTEVVIPVETNQGYLLTRKIDFNKTVHRWLDYEILQLLIELWENDGSMVTHLKHSLHNLNGSLSFAKTNENVSAVASQLEVLKTVHQNLLNKIEQQKKLATEFEKRLENDFYVTKVYKDKNFLEVSLQSSFSQVRSSNKSYLLELKERAQQFIVDFSNKYEERLSSSPERRLENSSKCISYRMFKESNANYDTLFLNKTLVGELFIVPRLDEEKRIETTVKQWKEGFNKSILITGDVLSGKTTFLEHISRVYFKKDVIFLEPNSEVVIEGRKFQTTSNLKQAIHELKKDIYHVDPIVIIDDLELWQDDKNSFLDNVRALLQFIETDSDEALVIAATSREMQKHLDRRLLFSNLFSTVVDLSKSKQDEINKALYLRHGASHKKLVDEKEQPLTPKVIENHITSLSKEFDYNLGEVLQAWTYNTTVTDSNDVIFSYKNLPLEDFFTDEEVIILKYLLLYRKVNELQLKFFLGNRLERNYFSAVKRLINAKVLLRNEAGFLVINPVLNFDIHRILKYRGIFI